MFFSLLVLPSLLAVSFFQTPYIDSSSSNISTTDSFVCRFTPEGSGSLTANITWFVNGSPWHYEDQSFVVSSGVEANSSWISPDNTSKHQEWICQVTLFNDSLINVSNSSSIEVLNTLPTIADPPQLIFFEDSPSSFLMHASDPDNDSFQWFSNDLSKSSYGNEELFDIGINGSVLISQFDESLVGNHTMQIVVYDEPGVGSVRNFNFELLAVNDLPIFDNNSLSYSCVEGHVCSGDVNASDQDNVSSQLIFAFNESFINASSDGSFSFIPTYSQAVKNNLSVSVNVSDGINFSFSTLKIVVSSTNHVPNFSYVNVSAVQNQSENFIFYFNVTDSLDSGDVFFFDINSSCGKDVWQIQNVSNGSGSTTAVGLINTSLFSNDFVECRNVVLLVSEFDESSMLLKDSYSFNLLFNISNINDPPFIDELNLDEVQSNISSQSGAIGLGFSYQVNASDPDLLTYEGDSLFFSLLGAPVFSDGSPMFIVDSASGLVSSAQSSMNSSYVGNFSFFVLVNDSLSPSYSFKRLLSINISYNYPPSIGDFNSSACNDSFLCLKNFSAFDFEGSKSFVHLLNLTYTNPLGVSRSNYSSSEIASLFNINTSGLLINKTTFYFINFTPLDSDLGQYFLTVNFSDDVGNYNSTTFSFNISNTPQNPAFDNDESHSVLDPIDFGIFAESLPFYKYIYFYDPDLTYGLDNLTFNFSFINGSLSNFSITQINNSLAIINYTADEASSGNYSLNLTLVDSYNLSSFQIVNFTVHDSSEFPYIFSVRPFFNQSINSSSLSFVNISKNVSSTNISFSENDSVVFDIRVRDADNLSLNVSWFVDGVFNSSHIFNASNPDVSLIKYFSFFENGSHNISVNVSDIGFDSFTWFVNVSNLNRPPVNLHPMDNLTGTAAIRGSGGVFFANFFKLYWDSKIVFYDPDDDLNSDSEISGSELNNLLFSINESGGCDELASFVFDPGTDDVTITPLVTGSCQTNFIATDPFNRSVSSNDVEIEIIKVQSNSGSSSGTRTVTVTQTVTIPLETDVDVPASFQLLFPGISAIYDNGSVQIPLSLINTWSDDLGGISLFVNDSINNLTYRFADDYFDLIPEGGVVNTSLTLFGYRQDAPFEFNVSARIASLDNFVDEATVYVNALEKGSEDINSIKSRISFARDLLSDNPECSELVGVLQSFEDDPSSASLSIVNNVINGCKYLMGSKNNLSNSLPKTFSGRLVVYGKSVVDFNLLIIILSSLFGLSIVIFAFSKFFIKKI